MAIIRRGSTQTGGLVFGPLQVIQPVSLTPHPPEPPVTATATIDSYQTPVLQGSPAHVVAKVTHGQPDQFRWQAMAAGQWQTAATVPASQLGYDFHFATPGAYPIRLQTLVGGQVTDQTGTPRVIQVTAKPPDPPQPPSGQPITFRTADGHYVTAENGGGGTGQVVATRTVAGLWETFTRHPQPDGRCTYQSSGGFYLTAENGGGSALTCSRTVPGPWESFREIPLGGGLALQSDDGHFVCAENGGGGAVNVTRTTAGPWETFNVPVPAPPGTVTPVHPDGHVFRTADGTAWRWKGVSAFQLCDRWARGEDISAFLAAYQGFNVLRVWSYVEGPNWTDPTWESPAPGRAAAFVQAMNKLGFLRGVDPQDLQQPCSQQHGPGRDRVLQGGGPDGPVPRSQQRA